MSKVAILLVVTGAVIFLLPGTSSAQYLSVKANFWGTLQYTRNGIEYTEFGSRWGNLLTETEPVEEAHESITDSRNLHYAGTILGLAGGAILGYATGLESRNEEVDDAYWVMGGSTVLASLICELVSRHKLERGLLAYNKQLAGSPSGDGEAGKFDIGISGKSICLTYNF